MGEKGSSEVAGSLLAEVGKVFAGLPILQRPALSGKHFQRRFVSRVGGQPDLPAQFLVIVVEGEQDVFGQPVGLRAGRS